MSTSAHGRQYYLSSDDDAPLAQGDILRDVSITSPVTGVVSSESVIVLTHDCEIDKPRAEACLVAVVTPYTTNAREIRDNKAFWAIPLPTIEVLGHDVYVNLRKMHLVSFARLGAESFREESDGKVRVLSRPAERIARLSDEGVEILQGRLVMYFTRRKLA